jgi:hypothetical protein
MTEVDTQATTVTRLVAYMSKQQALLRALIAQCEVYAEEEEEEEEAREGEEDSV